MTLTGADEGIPRGLLPARSISGSGGPAASTPRPATCGSAQGRGRGDDADEGIPQGLLPVHSTGRSGGPAASPPRSAQGRGQRDGAGEGFQDSDASRVRGGRVGSQVMHGCFGLHLRACAVCQLARTLKI
ncbi:uncharacterized protein LOC120701500 [Panicum virgatum]|uniref:uncharacterized protein LOC120701500 n=1 Tax=Panicum virgatum TaxID=38727 RepID=UPI0019D58AC3|nr:uncharacterized protein LOC120701500 [Panicum virgatum]